MLFDPISTQPDPILVEIEDLSRDLDHAVCYNTFPWNYLMRPLKPEQISMSWDLNPDH